MNRAGGSAVALNPLRARSGWAGHSRRQRSPESSARTVAENPAEVALQRHIDIREGDRQAKINRAEGQKQEMIAESEGEKQKRINEAEGRAAEIEKVAMATALGIREIAKAINERGGHDAVNLRVAEQYITEFGNLAKINNSMIIPTDLADIAGVIKTATSVIQHQKSETQGQIN